MSSALSAGETRWRSWREPGRYWMAPAPRATWSSPMSVPPREHTHRRRAETERRGPRPGPGGRQGRLRFQFPPGSIHIGAEPKQIGGRHDLAAKLGADDAELERWVGATDGLSLAACAETGDQRAVPGARARGDGAPEGGARARVNET